MKINTKKRNKWRYVYHKFGITQRISIEDTKERSQIRVEVKTVTYGESYEDSNILFLESRAHSMSLQICMSFLTIYIGCNIW